MRTSMKDIKESIEKQYRLIISIRSSNDFDAKFLGYDLFNEIIKNQERIIALLENEILS